MCGVKNMNIKTVLLATLLSAFPIAVQAQDTGSLDNYQVACNSGAECNDFEVNYEQTDGDDEVAQVPRRTRTRRTRSAESKYYAGLNLGIFFPGEIENTVIDPDTGFGGSVYGGYKFSEYISADGEVLLAFGGNDFGGVDGSYTLFGVFLNPRFTYTFEQDTLSNVSDNLRGLYVFASPGIGYANYSIGGDLGDNLDEANQDDSGGGFAIQGKIGAGYPVSDKIDIIGQARYTYVFNAFEIVQTGPGGVTSTEDEGFDTFGIEVGAKYNF